MEAPIDWRLLFVTLDGMVDPSPAARRQRGRDFEGVLASMLDEAGMHPRSSFRPQGEEIDGSFLYRGRPMLFEAKWTSDPIPASSLYQFKGKLDGKLTGTLGIFISMAGYSSDAVDALVAGKELNLILFDGKDVREMARRGGPTVTEALDRKLRAAAEKGTPFFPLTTSIPKTGPTVRPYVMVVVEGQYDAEVLTLLAQRTSGPTVAITPTTGRANLPLVALAQLSLAPNAQTLIMIADGDGRPADVRAAVSEPLHQAALPAHVDIEVLILEPNLETTLGLGTSPRDRVRGPQLQETIRHLDLTEAANRSDDLRRLLTLLGWSE